MSVLKATNDSYYLVPDEAVTGALSGALYNIDASANWNCYLDIDSSVTEGYTLQFSFTDCDGSGTCTLYASCNGTDYDNIVDDDGNNVTVTITGTGSYTINNKVTSFGTIKVGYAKGTNTDGTVAINLRR